MECVSHTKTETFTTIELMLEQWNTMTKLFLSTQKLHNQLNNQINNQINNDTVTITVVTMTGRQLKINVCPMNKIVDIKKEIYKQDGIPLDQQRLGLKGTTLDDDKYVYEYGMDETSRVHLILRLRGGMFHESSSRMDYISIENKFVLDKGLSMIRYMRDKYGNVEKMDEIHGKLIQCTDSEIKEVVQLIEKYYIAV
jgi:hypothetical protein